MAVVDEDDLGAIYRHLSAMPALDEFAPLTAPTFLISSGDSMLARIFSSFALAPIGA